MVLLHIYAYTFLIHPVVDVSAQGGCTITPINPTTLTAAGGILAIGTVNVIIQCNCIDDYGTVIDSLRWYDPDGTRLLVNTNNIYIAGTPYYRRVPDDTNILLVIPTFNESYDGTYTCGRRSGSLPVGAPNFAVELTINSKLIIYIASQLYEV